MGIGKQPWGFPCIQGWSMTWESHLGRLYLYAVSKILSLVPWHSLFPEEAACRGIYEYLMHANIPVSSPSSPFRSIANGIFVWGWRISTRVLAIWRRWNPENTSHFTWVSNLDIKGLKLSDKGGEQLSRHCTTDSSGPLTCEEIENPQKAVRKINLFNIMRRYCSAQKSLRIVIKGFPRQCRRLSIAGRNGLQGDVRRRSSTMRRRYRPSLSFWNMKDLNDVPDTLSGMTNSKSILASFLCSYPATRIPTLEDDDMSSSIREAIETKSIFKNNPPRPIVAASLYMSEFLSPEAITTMASLHPRCTSWMTWACSWHVKWTIRAVNASGAIAVLHCALTGARVCDWSLSISYCYQWLPYDIEVLMVLLLPAQAPQRVSFVPRICKCSKKGGLQLRMNW